MGVLKKKLEEERKKKLEELEGEKEVKPWEIETDYPDDDDPDSYVNDESQWKTYTVRILWCKKNYLTLESRRRTRFGRLKMFFIPQTHLITNQTASPRFSSWKKKKTKHTHTNASSLLVRCKTCVICTTTSIRTRVLQP